MQLFNHQKRILELNPAKKLLCWGTGTGKSLASIFLAKKNCETVLIVVPKSLLEKWRRDVKGFIGLRKELYAKVISKEEFKKYVKELGPFDGLIIDEGHYFSGMKSALHKSLLWYTRHHKTKYVWVLTATPYLSTPWNIFALARILGKIWSYTWFFDKFFYRKYIYGRYIPVVKTGIEEDIAAMVAEIADVVRLEDCADVPEQVFEVEHFVLTKKQLKRKKEVTEEESNPVVKYTKFHQIENGTLKGDDLTPHEFIENDKTDRILDIIRDNDKVAVFCRYNLQIDLLKKEIEKEFQRPILVIRGDVKNRDEIVQLAEGYSQCIVLINAACSEGYELPSIGVIVFASLSFSYKDYMQSLGRFLRINKLKKNVYIHLVARDSVDEAVYHSIMKKQDFDIAIYNEGNRIPEQNNPLGEKESSF